MKRLLYSFLFLIFYGHLFSQEESRNIDFWENYFNDKTFAEPTNQLEDQIETISYYLEHPLNLNQAGKEKLEELGLLTPFQIASLLDYRSEFGEIISFSELNYIYGFDRESIELISPLVFLGREKEEGSNSRTAQNAIIRYQQKLQEAKGYRDTSSSGYIGNPGRVYFRYQTLKKEVYQYGLTMEKDPGEALFSSLNNSFDFISGHVALYNRGVFHKIVAGDYKVNFGQGAILWTGFSMGKGLNNSLIRKSGKTLDAYSSSNENRFLRGMATEIRKNKWSSTIFLSYKRTDANLTDSSRHYFTSLPTDGIHNTQLSLRKKDALKEFIMGVNAGYQLQNGHIHVNLVYMDYNASRITDDKIHKLNSWSGNHMYYSSVDYSLSLKKLMLFGEFAANKSLNWAILNGAYMQILPELSVGVIYRNYNATYSNPWASSFGENSSSENEEGIYTGIKINLLPGLVINAYADVYRFPWLKYQMYNPTLGHEEKIQVTYSKSKDLKLRLNYQSKEKETYLRENKDSPVFSTRMLKTEKARIRLRHAVHKLLTLSHELQFAYVKERNDNGVLFAQTAHIRSTKWKVNLDLRYAVFRTDSYDTRLYIYENDLLYAFSIPSFSGEGQRFYINLRWKTKAQIDLYLKYSSTFYQDRTIISSGSNEIEGSRQSELKFQIIMKL